MKSIILLSILSVLLLASSTQAKLEITIYEGGNPGDFDFYLFVQQWIFSYCGQQTCVPGKERAAFTIHGLWPENNGGSYPSFCKGPDFSANEIADLLNQLDTDWPSLTGPNTDFWTHEWSKHGTCSITGPITDIHSYFSSGLKLYSTYNITKGLEENNIYPSSSNTYAANRIVSALTSNFGATPAMQCQGGNLSTVAVCITKDTLEIMDCPNLSGWSCSGQISWPDHS
eukprot:gene4612-5761_t